MRAVDVRDLVVRFDGRPVLKGVSLSVGRGERLAVLGPNGSGKTTLLRAIVGVLEPDEGSVEVLGERPPVEGLSYVPQGHAHYEYLTPRENLRFFARMYGVPGDGIDGLVERFGLPDRRAGELSGGQRRRLDLAVALLPDPEVLILDEPTEGLDVGAKRDFLSTLERVSDERDVTVVFSTHDPVEAERLADRVVILDDGRVVAEGSPRELSRRVCGEPVVVVEGDVRGEEALPYPYTRVGDALRVRVGDPEEGMIRVLETLLDAGSRIEAVRVEEPGLADVLTVLVGGEG